MGDQTLRGTSEVSSGVIAEVISRLPTLPPVIRYYDDFDETRRAILNPDKCQIFELIINGRPIKIDFRKFDRIHAHLLKHIFLSLLAEDLAVSTAANYLIAAPYINSEMFQDVLSAGPHGISRVWIKLRARELPLSAFCLIKALLRLLCQHRLQGWSNAYDDYVSCNLPLPARDAYAGVLAGSVFLSANEEAAIVSYLDNTAAQLISNESSAAAPNANLIDACMLLCAFQFGMRPIQIARLSARNVRIFEEANGNPWTVHLTFHMAKQRAIANRKPLTRRVKAEWSPMFYAWNVLRQANVSDTDRFFPVKSNFEVSLRISTLVRHLLGTRDLGTATDLRHTAAQRLVDAGASHEELAEFMGHSSLRTGLVYYESSANHAERVNRALGASTIYRKVVKIAHDKFISAEELAQLKGDQQIAGVAHGISISGIGGCSSGQPACPYNPITSCYGCRKFMPVHEKQIHQSVLRSMRETVLLFNQASRADVTSPTYLQLQRTISEIQGVVEELEEYPL